jgi:hypothetical protein
MSLPNKNEGQRPAESKPQATLRDTFRHVYRFILEAVKGDKATANAIFEDYLAGNLSEAMLLISRRSASADQASSHQGPRSRRGRATQRKLREGGGGRAGVGQATMMPSLRFREYIQSADFAHQRAQNERNSHAKQILQEIERSYRRLIEMEKWEQQYNRPFAHFGLFDGR